MYRRLDSGRQVTKISKALWKRKRLIRYDIIARFCDFVRGKLNKKASPESGDA